MEQTTLTPTRCFVRDLADGQEVNDVFVVRAHTRRQRRNGEPFLKLQLGDMSGAVEAVIWDEVDSLAPICPAGAVVRILGRYSVDERYGAAVTVKRMRSAAEHEYDLGDLTEAPPVSYEEMVADLGQLLETIRRPHLKELPSFYFRRNCFATFQDDAVGLRLAEAYDLTDNFLWANDYPHHEGSWPHSAEAIERTFEDAVDEPTRAKLLGLNAARAFNIEVPQKYR